MGRKHKTLAQSEIGSKKWDEEMERQNPGWGKRHAARALIGQFPIPAERLKRLTGPAIDLNPLPPLK
ncbi:hypothetical protein [Noviherbaspirillum galbum]|uniref:Uncharacterized protein n=1 Tax=Noviherbaspirillum galbum TaxID=2709383 RepID=A0A6B3SHN9_9BURK|nr:hypothetical protein [Noviherbaspirillum galbum]NEX60170.1 hypothetical protein [Noviherbaspirillum galbum]